MNELSNSANVLGFKGCKNCLDFELLTTLWTALWNPKQF